MKMTGYQADDRFFWNKLVAHIFVQNVHVDIRNFSQILTV